jgi:hypothetical protein
LWVGTAVLGAGSLIAAAFPFSTRATAAAHGAAEAAAAQASGARGAGELVGGTA